MIGHKNNKTKGTNNAPIPEDNEQYCFRMPLKLEVHKRYWTTHFVKCTISISGGVGLLSGGLWPIFLMPSPLLELSN